MFYLLEITIQERLAQKRIELRHNYSKVEEMFKSHKKLIKEFSFKQSLDKEIVALEKSTTNGYKEILNNNIIPFVPHEKTLSIILERIYNKTTPFLNAQGASDKGFKDTLLWLTLLDFFKKWG